MNAIIEWFTANFTLSDLPGWLGLVFGGTSLLVSWRNLSWAKRSAVANEKAADASVRSANAAEKAAAYNELTSHNVSARESSTSTAPDVSWTIEHFRNAAYVLINSGSQVATGVTADATPFGGLARELPKDAAVRAGGQHRFLLVETWQKAAPREMWLTWDGQDEPVAVPMPYPTRG
ncbi:hypothetical protein AB0B45_02730 [Nonomuraea sp. NPDC049152]|uniref:hypothetical protein n=1 Tax=Nonomuraea sp. NPDC049152 TaxID=3154350 RepID=UPI0033D97CA1